jgi:hypothetical protein
MKIYAYNFMQARLNFTPVLVTYCHAFSTHTVQPDAVADPDE